MMEQVASGDDEELKDAIIRDDISKEEQMDILTAFVNGAEIPKHKGSKVANPAGLTGVGTSLNFTDSNVWKQLKADMGEEATSMNRIFDVDVEDLQDVELSDGYRKVTVKALILGEYVDKEPAKIGSKE